MRNALLFVALLWSAALTAYTVSRHAPSTGETSCEKLAYNYVKQVADSQGLKITYWKLQACHQLDATHSVARAEVNVTYYGLVQDVVLVFKFTKSPWQISDVHSAG